MNTVSILLSVALAAAAGWSVYALRKRRGSGCSGCDGCSGGCHSCRHREKK